MQEADLGDLDGVLHVAVRLAAAAAAILLAIHLFNHGARLHLCAAADVHKVRLELLVRRVAPRHLHRQHHHRACATTAATVAGLGSPSAVSSRCDQCSSQPWRPELCIL